jgi:hypothetical protein
MKSTICRNLYFVTEEMDKAIDDYEIFDPDVDVTPRVRYFDPFDSTVSKLVSTIAAGHRIETLETDGLSIPLPNLNASLRTDNSQILQSALPLSVIKTANDVPNRVRKRAVHKQKEQPVGKYQH